MNKEKLMRIRKKDNRGAVGVLYEEAKETQDPKLIREMNKIIKARRLTKSK